MATYRVTNNTCAQKSQIAQIAAEASNSGGHFLGLGAICAFCAWPPWLLTHDTRCTAVIR